MLGHGADLDSIKRKYKVNRTIIDFSSNINPAIPEGIGEILLDNIDCIRSYPDIEYMDLRSYIGTYIGSISEENICVGNGATELIFLFMKLIEGRVAIIGPSFSEYARACQISGIDYELVNMNFIDGSEDKRPSFDIDVFERLDMIDNLGGLVVCNPNNPDGRLRDLSSLVDYSRSRSIKLLVDETFIEFCNNYKLYTSINYDYDDIFILRAMTKFYGMPGLRMGYLFSRNIEFINELYKIKEPWTVNSMAEKVTLEILKREVKDEFLFGKNTRLFYERERKYMLDRLDSINGIREYETDSAFILLEINRESGYNSASLKDLLVRQYGILIRDASNFEPLDDRFVRIAIKDRESNDILLGALLSIFGGKGL
nr:aminotransferase class I/II-fold pyridoxal phosphate-dependent enzyme [uncultured Peptostreptococcus sp.]